MFLLQSWIYLLKLYSRISITKLKEQHKEIPALMGIVSAGISSNVRAFSRVRRPGLKKMR